MTRLSVVGNPGHRRVTMFSAAAVAAGWPAPEVFAWRDVLREGRVPGSSATVRIESPGEDPEVDLLLRSSAGPGSAGVAEHGEILGLARSHAGLSAALDVVAAGGGRLLNQPADIRTMNDKPRCHERLRAAGVPVPEALPQVTGWAELREAMRAQGWGRVFVKPAYGSSASGVLALTAGRSRVSAITSVERAPDGRLFNSLRVRRYDREQDVAAIVDRLAGDGLHVERWFPKAEIGDRTFDLRVVVIAGRPEHIVVRASPSPMTNLHLGNARGDVAAVWRAAGPVLWKAALLSCVRAAGCFPRTLQVGVDLMIGVDWRRHAIAEVNAFGDLLPGVLVAGQDTYAAQVSALADGRYDRWAEAACAA